MEKIRSNKNEGSRKKGGLLSRVAGRAALIGVAAGGIGVAVETVSAEPAAAIAYTRSVQAPESNGYNVTGKANINTDCEDTFGCWSYIKIEKSRFDSNNMAGKFVEGHWAGSDGTNKVTAVLGDCALYRTVVDTYNKVPRNSPISVQLGPVSVGGDGLGMYHDTSASNYTYLCPPKGSGGGGW